MSHTLAQDIRRQMAELAEIYRQRLADIGGGYEQLSAEKAAQIAQRDLELIAQAVETGDPAPFLEHVRMLIAERLVAGFDIETLLQALTAVEDVLWPLLQDVKEAHYVGSVMRQARGIVAELTVQRLRDSESQYRMLADRLPVGVFIYQQDGLMRYVGGQAVQLLGYDSPEEMLGRPVMDFVAPSDRKRAVEIVRRRLAGEKVAEEYQLRLLCRDGSELTTRMHATEVSYYGQRAIQGAFIDITQQERQTRRLQRLARAVEATNDAVVITDAEGTIQFVNPAFERVTGYSASEALGENPRILKSGQQPDEFYTQMWQTISSGQVWQGDVTNRRQDGSLYEAELSISPIRGETGEIERYVAIQRDVTAQRRLQERLAESERQFRQLFDRSPVGVFRTTADGKISEANPAFLDIVGYDSLEAINRVGVPALYRDPADRERLLAELEEGPVSGFETRFHKADGETIFVSISVRMEKEGRILEGILDDISQRKRLEQTIQQSLERRERQVETSTQVAQEIAAAPALDELFQRVVTLIKERFDYYHAQIFRYEPALDAVLLMVGYGETGAEMLAAGHRLDMGRGVVGTAAATGQSVLASDVTQDPDWVPNPFLPETKGELAVPIKLRDEVLGILDVQSDVVGDLSAEDQLLLEGLCGQIAIAIESTRLRQETEQRLREMDALYGTMTRQAWQTVEPQARRYVFDPAMSAVLETEEAEEDAVTMPVMFRGEMIGMVGVYDDPQTPLSTDQMELILSVNEQAAQALESARLFEEAQARAEEQTVLSEMGRVLGATMDMDEVLESVYQYTSRLMDTNNFYIAFYDEADQEISFPLAVEEGEREQWEPRRQGKGLTERVIEEREPVFIQKDIFEWREKRGVNHIGKGAQVWLGVPMMIGEQVLGIITVQSYTSPLAYTEHDLELLSAVAGQAAIAIQNTRLFQETRSRAEEMAVLNELAQALTATLNVQDVLDETYRGVSRLLDATNFYVGLYQPEQNMVEFLFNVSQSEIEREIVRLPADQGLTGYIIRNQEPVLIKEDVPGWLERAGIPLVGEVAASWLGVPMIIGDQVMGVMAIQDFDTPRLYDEDDRDVLAAVASQAAIAVQNARLYEEAQSRAKQEAALRAIATTVSASEDLAQSMPALVENLSELVPVDTLAVTAYTPDDIEYELLAVSDGGAESTSEPGTRIPIRGTGSGWVITRGEPWLSDDIRRAGTMTFSETSELIASGLVSRLILPLQIGERVVGTLNLGSSQPGAYSQADLSVLTQIADQVASALERARLLEETQAALAEVEATNRRYLYEQWESLLTAGEERVWGYMDGPQGLVPADELWTPEIERAVETGHLVTWSGADEEDQASNRVALAIPIRLRGQTIGVLDFYQQGEERVWTDDDKALVEALADQIAQALETQRLFEQTQSRALRERLTGEIVGKIRSADDIQGILEAAAQELGRVLGVSRALIRLEPTSERGDSDE